MRRVTPRVVPRSGLPSARQTARRVVGINRPARRRRPVQDDDGTSPDAPNRAPNPYEDPSRDLGEGPDGLSRTQTIVLWVGIFFAIYLGSASCGTADLPPVPEHRCHICTEFTSGGNP